MRRHLYDAGYTGTAAAEESEMQYLPFGEKLIIEVFDKRVREDYRTARNDMSIFVDSFIETGTKLQKDVRFVKALIDLIEQDESIDDDEVFPIGEDGEMFRKDHFDDLGKVYLPSFLLGIWHFIVVNIKRMNLPQLIQEKKLIEITDML